MPASAKTEDPILSHIRTAASHGALSHALLITGSGDRLHAARYAAAALECENNQAPCGTCAACRKVFADIHPDVSTVQDTQHKNIAVEIVRDVRADAYVQPNEGRRKVYLFPDCTLLTEQDQNVLLKLVEEGPPYAAFLFCAENPAVVLQTLRSRCVELKLRPARTELADVTEDTEALCRAAVRRRGAAAEVAVRLERRKINREELATLLDRCREAFAAALLLQYGREPEASNREIAPFLAKNLTNAQIMRTIELLKKYHDECAYNVGTGHVLGALAAELEDEPF
ncbi:MAG: DNA polymerase III subunit [Oscillibacter sp.]|nr:DNA polymerase III subunit [Oscillibacter sp.]